MISTSVPCSIQLGHEAPWRPRELELEVSENGAGGVYPSRLVRGAGTRDLKYPLCEERPRGACLGVSEGPRSLRCCCAERGWLGGTGLQRVGPGTL